MHLQQREEDDDDDTLAESYDGFVMDVADSYGSEVSVESGKESFRRSGSRVSNDGVHVRVAWCSTVCGSITVGVC